jgi:hypothetical protein
MMGSREGFRERRRRRKEAEAELARKTELVRSEARATRKRTRRERRRRTRTRRRTSLSPRNWRPALLELWTWVKAAVAEIGRRIGRGLAPAGRRLRPVAARVRRLLAPVLRPLGRALVGLWRGVAALLGPIAPFVAAGLFALVRGLGGLLDWIVRASSWTVGRARAAAVATAAWVRAHVTAARVALALALAACVAIAVSQFVDYRGIEIGGDLYSPDASAVAPAPQLGQEPTGDAHAYVMLPLALAAAVLAWLALRGRPRLALGVAALGAVGLIVTLAIDLPQALDTGRIGESYEGTEAQLLTGFWLELAGSAALLVAGLALWLFAGGSRRSARRSRRTPQSTAGASAARADAVSPSAGPRGAAGSGAGA